MPTTEELNEKITALEKQFQQDIAKARIETREVGKELESTQIETRKIEKRLESVKVEILEIVEKLTERVPSGTIFLYAGLKAPEGFLLCDGSEVDRQEYSRLFKVIGTTYGKGNGSASYNLPDLEGRVAIGAGDSLGLSARTLGQKFGTETHTLKKSEIPKHTHKGTTDEKGAHAHSGTTLFGNPKYYVNVHEVGDKANRQHQVGYTNAPNRIRDDNQYANSDHTHNFITNTDGKHAHAFATDNGNGGGKVHNNMQPSLVINYIIKT